MIITDEKILRMPCADVTRDEVGELIELLERELDNSARLGRPGIGLAAPQINIHKKIAIVRIDNTLRVNLINAKIENMYDSFIFKDEGCLSFPGKSENTRRFQEIHVTNNLDKPHSFIATGLLSVACQHELDHCNGVLFTDIALPKIDKNIKPNDICLCGSGKKYKKCCRFKLGNI
jgi:peptide deformylase